MNTFKKEERLCSKKSLDLLFKNGSSFLVYPFRITYFFIDEPHEYPAHVVINVAKKRYKRAVDRNLIKRRTREAYRVQKEALLYSHLQSQSLLLISLQFIGKEKYAYDFFERKLGLALKKLTSQINPDEVH